MMLLSIDYSTNSTGYAVFDTEKSLKESLLEYGVVKPKVKGITKLTYPKGSLLKCISQAEQLNELIKRIKPDEIIMEEINPGISRMGQKSLCGGHYIFYYINLEFLNLIKMINSDGNDGWRSRVCLDLRLSKNDKTTNARRRKRNKETRAIAKKAKKRVTPGTILPIITKKHKAAEVVNSTFQKSFDVDSNPTDNDVCDAIGLGIAYLVFIAGYYEGI